MINLTAIQLSYQLHQLHRTHLPSSDRQHQGACPIAAWVDLYPFSGVLNVSLLRVDTVGTRPGRRLSKYGKGSPSDPTIAGRQETCFVRIHPHTNSPRATDSRAQAVHPLKLMTKEQYARLV